MSTKRVLANAIDLYGEDSQLKMLLEEMSELQKEICKHWRGADNRMAIAEEIADVEIMLEQVRMMFHIHSESDEFRAQKLARLANRISAELAASSRKDDGIC